MNIAVLGTGMVGNSIATKLIELGHKVKMGSRTKDNPNAVKWTEANGENASNDTFKEAAKFGEIVFNATAGMFSIEALKLAGKENLRGKILVDIANSLDTSNGMPPILGISNTTSLGEEIQKEFPDTKVVKTLNTMNCYLMVNPSLIPGDHDVFISGNDAGAKKQVEEILKSFGWKNPIDLGDITTARGTEMYLPLWLRLWGSLQNPNFNIKVVQGPQP